MGDLHHNFVGRVCCPLLKFTFSGWLCSCGFITLAIILQTRALNDLLKIIEELVVAAKIADERLRDESAFKEPFLFLFW